MLRVPYAPLPLSIARAFLGGRSFIDQEALHIADMEQAHDFALHYGYDLAIPHQREHVVKVFEDALSFTEEVILEGVDIGIPKEFFELQDPAELLVWASRRPRDLRARWACAILRVMHTLVHVDNNLYLRFLPEIQQQVFDRYEHYLVPGESGKWKLKGQYEVPLLAFRRKENKDRVSMLLKLLHKPENVAETVYDLIGLRFVAEDLLGGLMVIRFLLDHHVIMPHHLKVGRTRNLMVDLTALDRWISKMPSDFDIGILSLEERARISESLTLKKGRPATNPFSASSYSALQFTTTTLIRLPGPAVTALERVQARLLAMGKPEIGDLLRIPELIQEQEEYTFFFAHEVQIMERTGFEGIASGPASHAEYKQRQREAARTRVLQGIMTQEGSC
ncbi:TIGR04552 family protein [Holophaga foetida]|uniref:TIGR04552 family protein n=1 Tax=Holophaga foetida TaxID=35839 RepID=UPI0002472631|nr:TIGR04552 family protein [Holophaga foetida]